MSSSHLQALISSSCYLATGETKMFSEGCDTCRSTLAYTITCLVFDRYRLFFSSSVQCSAAIN